MGMVAVMAATVVSCAIMAYVVGFATSSWLTNRDGWTKGLWQTCDYRVSSNNPRDQCKTNISNQPGYINACRVFLTLGLFMVKMAWSVVVGSAMKGKYDRTDILKIQIGITGISTLFSFMGVIIFGLAYLANAEPEIVLGWSYYLTVAGFVLLLTTTLLSLLDFKYCAAATSKSAPEK